MGYRIYNYLINLVVGKDIARLVYQIYLRIYKAVSAV